MHTLQGVELEWDEEKAAANLRKHGVDFADAVLVFEDNLAVAVGDPDARHEERFITMGRDSYGGLLVVVYTWRGERILLITERTATGRERRHYETGT